MRTRRDLHTTLDTIQLKWGSGALHPIGDLPRPACLPTGIPALDAAVGGGFPRSRLTELAGAPTSGVTTLALQALAQQASDLAVYIDPPRTFDPEYAAGCGVQVEALLLARPQGWPEALDILFDTVVSGLPGVVIVNARAASPSAHNQLNTVLGRLQAGLTRTACVLLALTAPDTNLSAPAALRLLLERERWLVEGRAVRGVQTRATTLRPAGRAPVSVEIAFGEGRG